MSGNVILLNRGWKFCRGEVRRWHDVPHMLCYDMTKAGYELGVESVLLNENPWEEISLPHDWSAHEPADREHGLCSNGYKRRGIGWYYLQFHVPSFSDDESVLLEFEGVMGDCLVYVNGARALRNHSGYNGFYADVTAYLIPDADNTLAVRVDTTTWEGWWYEGAGIYRPVSLSVRPSLHFRHLSPFARPQRTQNGWDVILSACIENSAEKNLDWRVKAYLQDSSGTVLAKTSAGNGTLNALDKTEIEGLIIANSVSLWSPDNPKLYYVVFELYDGCGNCVEQRRVQCGFREIEFTADRGMLLNGQPLRVNGICCHQDHVGVGIAVSKSLVRYRIKRLKEMGCNAYRCAHHMAWEYLLEVCDELGMLVMDENRHFNEMDETLQQVDDMVLRARNHPSVFMYCLFNEEYWQEERRGYLLARTLNQRIKQLDSSRPTTAAMNGGVLTEKNASDVVDVAGMNYFIKDYGNFAKRCPGKPLIGTENGPIYGTRSEAADVPDRLVFGAYGDQTSPTGELMGETMDAANAAPHVAGVFMWGGFDYRGEPTPFTWPSVFSHWGFTDMCGFRKDSSYMLESFYSKKPVVHIAPHWNHVLGTNVRVCVFSNGQTVELFLNGHSLGKKNVVHCRAEWNILFELGELKAIATMADGAEITDSVNTVGEPVRIDAEIASKSGEDMVIVNVRLLDDHGNIAIMQDHDIHIYLENGELAGVGNGNPNAAELPDITDTLPTFHGLCQVLIKTNGSAHLTLKGDNLTGCELVL